MLKIWWQESLPRLRSHVNGTITDSTVVAVHSFPATGELEAALVFQPMRCLGDRRVPNCHGDCTHADQSFFCQFCEVATFAIIHRGFSQVP